MANKRDFISSPCSPHHGENPARHDPRQVVNTMYVARVFKGGTVGGIGISLLLAFRTLPHRPMFQKHFLPFRSLYPLSLHRLVRAGAIGSQLVYGIAQPPPRLSLPFPVHFGTNRPQHPLVAVVPEWLAARNYAGMRLEIAPISSLNTAWGERLKAAHVAAKPHLNWLADPSLFAA
jgi:hypothetical protein